MCPNFCLVEPCCFLFQFFFWRFRNVTVFMAEPLRSMHATLIEKYIKRCQDNSVAHTNSLARMNSSVVRQVCASTLVNSGRDVTIFTKAEQPVRVFVTLHRVDRMSNLVEECVMVATFQPTMSSGYAFHIAVVITCDCLYIFIYT